MIISRELFWKLVRFGIVGVIVMGCFVGLNAVFFTALHLGNFTSFLLAYPVALLVHYTLNKRWTFGSRRKATPQEVRDYVVTVLITAVIQLAAFAFFTVRFPGIKNWLASGCASAAQMIFSFLLMQKKVFAPAKTEHVHRVGHGQPLGAKTQAATALLVLLTIGLYGWSIGSDWAFWRAPAYEADYYNLQVHGFLHGHLSMDVPLPAGASGNVLPPGAPSLLDATYFQGRYYLYFGVAPAVTAFLPYRVIVGRDLPPPVAVLAFASLGFLLMVVALADLRRRYFAEVGGLVWLAAVLLLGAGTGIPASVRRSLFYEVASTASFAFWAAGFWCLVRATLGSRARWWLAGASAAFGLAIASRPNVGPAAALLLPFAALWLCRRGNEDRSFRGALGWLLAGGVPVVALVVALLVYNAARFGQPLEFGHNYQIGSISAGFTSVHYFWHNLQIYYLNPPALSWYFPFVSPAMEGVRPEGYIGLEYAHGQWIFLPFLVLLIALWVGVMRHGRRHEVGFIVTGLATWFGVNLVILCLISVRANRYSLDFHPALVALSAVGVLAIGALTVRGGRLLLGLIFAWVLAVGAFNTLASFGTQGYVRDNLPDLFHHLEVPANRVAWPLQRFFGRPPGPEEFSVVFVSVTPGLGEPLIYAGTPYDEDMLRIVYESPTSARLYFDHAGYGTVAGRSFTFVPGRRSTLTLALGTFNPPLGHPWYGDVPNGDQLWLRSHLEVKLDDQVILDGDSPTFAGTPPKGRTGLAAGFELTGPRFSGALRYQRSLPLDRAALAARSARSGRAELVVRLPRTHLGLTDPLVATGGRTDFNLVSVTYVDLAHVRFSFLAVGGETFSSGPIAVDYAVPHRIGVVIGTPPGAPLGSPVPAKLEVWLDGRRVLALKALQFPAPAEATYFGARPWAGNASRAIFGGEIISAERRPEGRTEAERAGNAGPTSELILAFPLDRTGVSEPLFQHGVAGQADGIFVQYLSDHSVRFGYDRWSFGATLSAPIEVDYAVPHTLRLDYGPFRDASDLERSFLRLTLDGQPVIDAAATPVAAASAPMVVGRNPTGMSTATAAFTGEIISARSVPTENKAAVVRRGGRIEMVLRLPDGLVNRAEPLLESGVSGAADCLFIRYVTAHSVVLGFDRWGTSGFESQPIEIHPGEPMSLVLGYGPLFPAGDPRAQRLQVSVNGVTALDRATGFFPATSAQIFPWSNPAGMSTCSAGFTGRVVSVRTLP